MTLYKLDEWEHNGRDDSDWYTVVYDDQTDKLDRILTGTTRGADALHIGPEMLEPTPEILVKARKVLARIFLVQIRQIEEQKVMRPNPEDLNTGIRVKFLDSHRCMVKEKTATDCFKCLGSGKWVNPRNVLDKRNCLACVGSGKVAKTYTRKKDEQGKQEWMSIEKGMVGTVISCKSFGTFYRNGWNKPSRGNTSVIIKLDDGREVRAPLAKLRLEREMETEAEMEKQAEKMANNGNFYRPFATAGVRL